MTVAALYRSPFDVGLPYVELYKPSYTLQDMVKSFPHVCDDFDGDIAINGVIIPRENWARVRPRPGTHVTFHSRIGFGGGDDDGGGGGKQVFGFVAAIALTLVTGFIASGGAAGLLGASFAAETTGAAVLAGGVGLAGSLALSALTSPPSVDASGSVAERPREGAGQRLEPASVEGNTLEPNAPIPRVVGTRRVFPPFAMNPYVERIGQNEFVHAVYILGGPHKKEDFRLGDSSIEIPANEAKDIEIETREGLPGEPRLDLNTRQGAVVEPQVELSTHIVDPENQDTLAGGDDLPVFHAVTTRLKPDENWLHFDLAGLVRQEDPDDSLRIPIRIRMRRRGNTEWRDLPEIHYQNVTQTQTRLQVKIFWGESFDDDLPIAPDNTGFVMARKFVPGQDVIPLGDDFEADSYFSDGSGDDVYESGTETTTNVRNIVLFPERVEVYLNDTPIAAEDWEFDDDNNSFSAEHADLTAMPDFSEFTGNDSDPRLISPSGLGIDGSVYRFVELDIERVTATGDDGNFQGMFFYVTGSHSFSPSFNKDFGDLAVGERKTIRLDMSDLTNGDDDWITSTIDQIRIDLDHGETDNFSTFNIHSIKIVDDNEWQPGIYDIEVIRGEVFRDTLFNPTNYTYDGDVLDFFGQTEDGTLPVSRSGLLDRLVMVRLVNIWNDYPIRVGNTALISLVARNRRVDRLSCVASGYVRDFDESSGTWTNLTTTSNPAPHFRDILTGSMNLDPLPEILLDDDGLEDWRDRCEDKGFTCDLVSEGTEIADLLRVVASCGFARLYRSEIWGVIQDFDRSEDTPIQLFTGRNVRGFSFKKAFSRLPSGFRVNFRDVDNEYQKDQMIVYRNGAERRGDRLEQVTFDGLVTRDDVLRRAVFDLRQAELRTAFYSFVAPVESIRCRRGSLIGVNHDIIQNVYGYGRIEEVEGPNPVTAIVLDSKVRIRNTDFVQDVSVFQDVKSVQRLGFKTAIGIRRNDGVVSTHRVIGTDGDFTDTLELEEDIDNPLVGNRLTVDAGCLVSVGILDTEFKRLVVSEIESRRGLEANIIAVDEANEIFEGLGI